MEITVSGTDPYRMLSARKSDWPVHLSENRLVSFEFVLCVHASVHRSHENSMGYDCTLQHLLLSGFEQAGKRAQSQVILETKAALCTYATALLLSLTVDTAMFTGVTKVEQGHKHKLAMCGLMTCSVSVIKLQPNAI